MAAGGYEYDFSSTLLDQIVYKICQCPTRDPYLSICCGHVFCKTCIDQVNRASSSPTCSVLPVRCVAMKGSLLSPINRLIVR